jgi:glutamine amidotransferase
MIGIIDYGVGNLFSLCSSLKFLGYEPLLSSKESELKKCSALILPGVGAFGAAVEKLKESGLYEFVIDQAKTGKQILGICLGMQLLFEKSYEFGEHDGLGLIKGEILPLDKALQKKNIDEKVPQIGWNSLEIKSDHYLTKYISEGDFVYYVHSYYAPVSENTIAFSNYGVSVTGIAACGNVAGCQFHPEKSGEVGLKILRAFCEKGEER